MIQRSRAQKYAAPDACNRRTLNENKPATERRRCDPLYDARIEDLGPGDFVKVECAACGHDVLIPTIGLTQGLRLPPYMPVLDLERRFRCRECDQRGKVVISIR